MGVEQPLPLIHGPFLLLYVYSLIRPSPAFRKIEWLHFLPVTAFYIFIFPDAFLLSASELLEFAFETVENHPPLYFIIFGGLINVSGVVYVIWSLIVLYKHKKNIEDNFSYTEKINLNWLKKLVIGMALIWATVLLFDSADYIYVAVTGFVFIIGFFGSRQGAIFTDNISSDRSPEKKTEKNKYKKSALTEKQSKEYLNSLNLLMDEEKPYLESKITLKDISERLEIHPNHLSQVINENLRLNFYDFINQYRVEEVKKRLAGDTSRRFTLLSHAYGSGYSSKSSFNEVFKKFTGLTPSQYQKQLYS